MKKKKTVLRQCATAVFCSSLIFTFIIYRKWQNPSWLFASQLDVGYACRFIKAFSSHQFCKRKKRQSAMRKWPSNQSTPLIQTKKSIYRHTVLDHHHHTQHSTHNYSISYALLQSPLSENASLFFASFQCWSRNKKSRSGVFCGGLRSTHHFPFFPLYLPYILHRIILL